MEGTMEELKREIETVLVEAGDFLSTTQIIEEIQKRAVVKINATDHYRKKINNILKDMSSKEKVERKGQTKDRKYKLKKTDPLKNANNKVKDLQRILSQNDINKIFEFTSSDKSRKKKDANQMLQDLLELKEALFQINVDQLLKQISFRNDIKVNEVNLSLINLVDFKNQNEKDWFIRKITNAMNDGKFLNDLSKLTKNFSYINNDLKIMIGPNAFIQRICEKDSISLKNFLKGKGRKNDKKDVKDYILEQAKEYDKEIGKFYTTHKPIDNTIRIEDIYKNKGISNELMISKFYSSDFDFISKWGKTKLGQLIKLAKLGNEYTPTLTKEICSIIKEDIQTLIQENNIDLIIWTPHTINRTYPFLPILKKMLNFSITSIDSKKINKSADQQKTMANLEDRINNAKKSLGIDKEDHCYIQEAEHILIIDDSVGSGATVNQIGALCKGIKNSVTCDVYSVTSSPKGAKLAARDEV